MHSRVERRQPQSRNGALSQPGLNPNLFAYVSPPDRRSEVVQITNLEIDAPLVRILPQVHVHSAEWDRLLHRGPAREAGFDLVRNSARAGETIAQRVRHTVLCVDGIGQRDCGVGGAGCGMHSWHVKLGYLASGFRKYRCAQFTQRGGVMRCSDGERGWGSCRDLKKRKSQVLS